MTKKLEDWALRLTFDVSSLNAFSERLESLRVKLGDERVEKFLRAANIMNPDGGLSNGVFMVDGFTIRLNFERLDDILEDFEND